MLKQVLSLEMRMLKEGQRAGGAQRYVLELSKLGTLQFLLCCDLGDGTPYKILAVMTQNIGKSLLDPASICCLPIVISDWDFQVPRHRCRKLYVSGLCLYTDYTDGCFTPEYCLSGFLTLYISDHRSGLTNTHPRLWNSSLCLALWFSPDKIYLDLVTSGIAVAVYQPGSYPGLQVLCNASQCCNRLRYEEPRVSFYVNQVVFFS